MVTDLSSHHLFNKKEFYPSSKEKTLLLKLNQEQEKLDALLLDYYKALTQDPIKHKLLWFPQQENCHNRLPTLFNK